MFLVFGCILALRFIHDSRFHRDDALTLHFRLARKHFSLRARRNDKEEPTKLPVKTHLRFYRKADKLWSQARDETGCAICAKAIICPSLQNRGIMTHWQGEVLAAFVLSRKRFTFNFTLSEYDSVLISDYLSAFCFKLTIYILRACYQCRLLLTHYVGQCKIKLLCERYPG